MTDKEKQLVVEKNMADASKRLEVSFGKDGQKMIKCENECGTDISVRTFSVFMLPEEKDFKVLFVCLHCCKQLMVTHNYQNKN